MLYEFTVGFDEGEDPYPTHILVSTPELIVMLAVTKPLFALDADAIALIPDVYVLVTVAVCRSIIAVKRTRSLPGDISIQTYLLVPILNLQENI